MKAIDREIAALTSDEIAQIEVLKTESGQASRLDAFCYRSDGRSHLQACRLDAASPLRRDTDAAV
jgi:hypothetical protein